MQVYYKRVACYSHLMEKTFIISKPEDFLEVIEEIFSYIKTNQKNKVNLITLKGDLGAGKTTFVQELGKYLKITEPISSPTFTIMKAYELDSDSGFERLVHMDAYRIEDESELFPLRLSEIIDDKNNLLCVEWPELIPAAMANSRINIEIKINEDETREVHLNTK